MNSELMVFGMRLNFHSLATFCIMTGAIYCSVHSTKCSYNDILRCQFSIHWEMLWLQCFLCSRHVLHQLLPPLSSASQNYICVIDRTTQDALWIVTSY